LASGWPSSVITPETGGVFEITPHPVLTITALTNTAAIGQRLAFCIVARNVVGSRR
jgi:hypothetical protein